MSQLSGAFTVELAVDAIADQIADRVLARLHDAARQATTEPPTDNQLVAPRTSGEPVYDRPDPERDR